MVPDSKRFCRVQYGYILTKLCKKFGANEIVKLVPGNDEVTHKRLKRIRKLLSREQRQKTSAKDSDDDGSEDETGGLERKSYT